ncbi:hypothetical protein [Nostoc sp. C117]|uniref:hypothetical protein n=1 Tax=Nostoc sp. C117 TaxID=3349875 RepID=UPI00370D78A4
MTFQIIQKTASTKSETPTTFHLSSRPFAPIIQQPIATPHQQSEQTKGLVQRKKNLLEIPLMPPPKKVIQAKLTIGEPGDKYEQEADTVARTVVQSLHQHDDIPTRNTYLTIGEPGDKYEQEADTVARTVVQSLHQHDDIPTRNTYQPKREFAQGLKAQILQRSREDGGVPTWAKEEYRAETKRTVICSMTPDGQIGSLYFDDGRIRTTHALGPQRNTHTTERIQFNIDERYAWQEFESEDPEGYNSPKKHKIYLKWLQEGLDEAIKEELEFPKWATLLNSPDAAHDLNTGRPSESIKLFEIFIDTNGKIDKHHLSRGVATKFDTDKQVISVLNAAIDRIDGMGLKDVRERNTEFYKFVKARLPKFVEDYIRHPDQIRIHQQS